VLLHSALTSELLTALPGERLQKELEREISFKRLIKHLLGLLEIKTEFRIEGVRFFAHDVCTNAYPKTIVLFRPFHGFFDELSS